MTHDRLTIDLDHRHLAIAVLMGGGNIDLVEQIAEEDDVRITQALLSTPITVTAGPDVIAQLTYAYTYGQTVAAVIGRGESLATSDAQAFVIATSALATHFAETWAATLNLLATLDDGVTHNTGK